MQTAQTLNRVILIVAVWVTANLVLYFGLHWLETSTLPGKDRVSHRTLKLYSVTLSDDCDDGVVKSPPDPSEKSSSLTASPSNSSNASDRGTQPGLLYRLMPPAKVHPGEKFPLLVYLHGSGGRGSDNRKALLGLPTQMAQPAWRTRFPCYVLVPQCPELTFWSNHDDALIRLVQNAICELPIDRQRIYLTGLSMGGYGTWHLAAKIPDLFAAAVPICGEGDTETASRLVNLPIWAVHGTADKVIPVDYSRSMIAAIKAAGGQPNYTELPNVGHDSWTQTYQDPNGVLKWLFAQVRQD